MPSSRIWSLRLQVGRDRVYGQESALPPKAEMAIRAVAVLFQPRILKDRRERLTTAVRQRIHPGLTIVAR